MTNRMIVNKKIGGEKMVKVKRGGISKNVWNTQYMQDYISTGYACGYIGSYARNNARDIIIEEVLREHKIDNEGIAMWLSSSCGRHFMDNVDENTSILKFLKLSKNDTKTSPNYVKQWKQEN